MATVLGTRVREGCRVSYALLCFFWSLKCMRVHLQVRFQVRDMPCDSTHLMGSVEKHEEVGRMHDCSVHTCIYASSSFAEAR